MIVAERPVNSDVFFSIASNKQLIALLIAFKPVELAKLEALEVV